MVVPIGGTKERGISLTNLFQFDLPCPTLILHAALARHTCATVQF